jgi:hypothetical protein
MQYGDRALEVGLNRLVARCRELHITELAGHGAVIVLVVSNG